MWSVIDKNKSKCDIIGEEGTVFGHVKTCKSKEKAGKYAAMIKRIWPDIELKGFKVQGGFDLFAAYYEYYDSVEEKTIKPPPPEDVPPGEPTVEWEGEGEESGSESESESEGLEGPKHAWSTQVFRLGVNGLDLNQALDLLEAHGIEIVFDIYFKSNQGFGLETFKKEAKKRGLTHLYVKSLGNPFHGEELEAEEMKRKYMDYLDKKYWCVKRTDYFPAKKIAKLRKVLERGARICFLCYCKYPDPCHTYWVIEKLLKHGINKKEHALRAVAPDKRLTNKKAS